MTDVFTIESTLLDGFNKVFNRQATGISSAPGRVNLIGEHTDYNQGFVLPCALDRRTYIAYKQRSDTLVRICTGDLDRSDAFDFEQTIAQSTEQWANYARGACHVLKSQGYNLVGIDLYVQGDVPQGAGLSSSAAFANALVAACLSAAGYALMPLVIAKLSQEIENDFLDCQCGIMDQLVSAIGLEGHAMLIDCDSLEYEAVPLPLDHDIVIIDSKVKRNLVDSEYNERRQTCTDAAQKIGASSLRTLNLNTLVDKRKQLTDIEFKRAYHVLTENQRTLNLAEAFKQRDFSKAYELMKDSHLSLRENYEVTIPETDWLFEQANTMLGSNGAARMTGGGFGGCLVALCKKDFTKTFIDNMNANFDHRCDLHPQLFRCQSGPGLEHKTLITN